MVYDDYDDDYDDDKDVDVWQKGKRLKLMQIAT